MNYLMGMKSFGLSYEDAQDKDDFLSLTLEHVKKT